MKRGPDSHLWVDGREHLKHAPKRLWADLQRLTESEELLSLVDELALLKARVIDLLKRVDTGESGRTWAELSEQVDEWESAALIGDRDEELRCVRRIADIVKRGTREWATWNELQGVILNVTKVAESQRRYKLEQKHMISTDAAFALMAELVEVIVREVPDERVHAIVAAEFAKRAGVAGYAAVAAGREARDNILDSGVAAPADAGPVAAPAAD